MEAVDSNAVDAEDASTVAVVTVVVIITNNIINNNTMIIIITTININLFAIGQSKKQTFLDTG